MAVPTAQNEEPIEKPTELSELETWTMYWCVISLFWVVDAWLGWTFRWYGASLLYKSYVEPFMSDHEGDLEDMLEAGRAKALSVLCTTVSVITNIVQSEFLAGQDVPTSAEEAEPAEEPPSERGGMETMEKTVPSQLQEMARSAGSTARQWVSDMSQQTPSEPPRRKLPRFRRKAN
ncbi:hypothetical protein MCAP1_000706 [Malassezia caprae]|uniref:Uncharacterized protein n=1 Tax=Malassezia caprae TaxID=1381934 RepID=A0AAF0IV92_9BASI|nr:hypothetical protein MCAP1_000706 [Malassezia caprae]